MKFSTTTWDELDFFIYRAFWSYNKYSNIISKRKKLILEIVQIFEELNIQYRLLMNKNSNEELKIEKKIHDKFVINLDIDLTQLSKKLTDKKFLTIKQESSKLFILKNNILLEINLDMPREKNLNKEFFNIESKKINIEINNLRSYTNILRKLKILINKIIKVYHIYSLLGFKKAVFFKKDRVYKLEYKSFLKIKIESESSINWLLRKPHLDLITQNKNKIIIKDIIASMKKENAVQDLSRNIIEVDTSSVFDEPIHINKSFWNGGNNFFIYPILFGFRKNVTPYKAANKYIEKNNDVNLYSADYYKELEIMTDSEIEQFLKENPIEITLNFITSGKHRVAAMIGRILENKDYINFYVKII